MPTAPSDAAQPTQAIPPVPSGPQQPLPPPPPPGHHAPNPGGTAVYDLSELQQPEAAAEEPDRSPNPRMMHLVLGAGFVALLLIAGAIAFTLGSGSSDGGSGETTSEGFDVALVADEDVDPEPLSVEEVFSDSAPTWDDGSAYERVRHEDTDDCPATAQADFAEALAEQDCQQALRAAYRAEDGEQAVTLGIVVFPTAEQARSALDAQDIDAAIWFSGLGSNEDDEDQDADEVSGYASSALYGRYIVFSLASATGEDAGEEDVEDLEAVSSRFLEVGLAPLGERAAT